MVLPSAATFVPDTYVPGQPAPTVPLAEAEAAQLAAANSTTSVAIAPLAPLTSLLATALTGLSTSEAASRNLWDSWQDKDYERAVLYASSEAVSDLFALPWTPETVNQGCGPSRSTEIAARCLFVQGTTVKVIDVAGSKTEGYKVSRVQTAQQDAPVMSVLPNSPTNPNAVAGGSGGLVDPAQQPADPAVAPTIAGAPVGKSQSARSQSGKGQESGTGKSSPSTTGSTAAPVKAKRSGSVPATTGVPAVPAAAPATRPPSAGVPAGAPVVNEVEG